jgi:hypothetical protein
MRRRVGGYSQNNRRVESWAFGHSYIWRHESELYFRPRHLGETYTQTRLHTDVAGKKSGALRERQDGARADYLAVAAVVAARSKLVCH